MQQLLANVQIILPSADGMTIDKLAEMADRIMDAATLTVPAVNTSTEDDRIHKICHEEYKAQHRSHPQNFSNSNRRGRNRSRRRSTSRRHLFDRQAKRDVSVGITLGSGRMPDTAVHHAQRETKGPAASGDQRGWPTNGSSFGRHRWRIQATFLC